jgi:hypothetical protein
MMSQIGRFATPIPITVSFVVHYLRREDAAYYLAAVLRICSSTVNPLLILADAERTDLQGAKVFFQDLDMMASILRASICRLRWNYVLALVSDSTIEVEESLPTDSRILACVHVKLE